MSVNKDLIMKLRSASQAGFADCKKALEENNNDLEASIKWLRLKGISKASNKNALKDASEGVTWTAKNDTGAVIIELNSETDFTASNNQFLSLAEEIVNVILSNPVSNIEEALSLKMPNGDSISDNCLHLSSITGEKIVLSKMQYIPISKGESVACYKHNTGKISTLLVLDKKLPDEDIKGLAVHYAANNPRFLDSTSLDESWVAAEKEIIQDVVIKENKPEQFRQKIIEERLKKVISSQVFVEQPYLYDSSKTVGEVLDNLGTKVKSVVYFSI